jgi:DNA-binding XRE family transcriptional regulator
MEGDLSSFIERGPIVTITYDACMVKTNKKQAIDPQKVFGARLVELRKQRGWSQEQLALESGIARSYLGGVERGQRNIVLVNFQASRSIRKASAGSFQLLIDPLFINKSLWNICN